MPMVSTGLSEVMGSWNTMEICPPRTWRISSPLIESTSLPPNRIVLPSRISPGGWGMRRRIDIAPTDLPQPDSPTIATVSPSLTWYVMPSTAFTVPSVVWNCVRRFSTSSSLDTATPSISAGDRSSAPHSGVHAVARRAGRLTVGAGGWKVNATTDSRGDSFRLCRAHIRNVRIGTDPRRGTVPSVP